MIYISISILLLLFSNITKKKEVENFFRLFLFSGTIFAVLRYGSGTDYFSYNHIYKCFNIKLSDYIFYMQSVEPGYALLNILGNKLKISYQLFLGVLTCFDLLILNKLLKDYSVEPILSLLIFFLNYYVPYFTNTIRQSSAMLIILLSVMDYYKKRNTIVYIFQILIISFVFHFSAIILITFPIFELFIGKKIYKKYKAFLFTIIFFLAGNLFYIFLLKFLGSLGMSPIIKKLIHYTTDADFSFMGLCVRLLFFLIIIYFFLPNIEKKSLVVQFMYRFYIYGVYIYLLFARFPIFSRFSDYFTFIEIILIPNLIYANNKSNKKDVLIILLILYFILFVKDLDAANQQGGYYLTGSTNYPYVTVFNKEKIFQYRKVPTIYLDK